MFVQRLVALVMIILTVVMVLTSGDATIAFLTIPMSAMLMFKRIEEEQNG